MEGLIGVRIYGDLLRFLCVTVRLCEDSSAPFCRPSCLGVERRQLVRLPFRWT